MRSITELQSFIDEVADLIANEKGQNVPYCESMDVSYLPIIVDIADEDRTTADIVSSYGTTEEDLLDDLRFLARNGRALPEDLAEATFEEFRTYVAAHKEEVLGEIEGIFQDYYDEYSG